MTTDDYRRFFAQDVAQLTPGERKAINNVARNFYRWHGHAATVDDLLGAIANPPAADYEVDGFIMGPVAS